MITTRFQSGSRLLVALVALGGMAIGVATAQTTDAAGLRNCVEIPNPPQSGRVGCYELVWADGVQYRMTFPNQTFDGATPKELDPFYVLAPQTDAPQGYPPNTFAHDHVVRALPADNHGTYSVQLQGFFVVCSGAGIVSGTCVPAWTSVGGPDPLPLATTVNGQPLTSTEAIEAAADAGHLVLINLGPGSVLVGTISGR
ncbi:MAG TPA: hypothetical protein VGQ02_08950 [Candidatus Limnocylindrales bacterium]|jgi:hypothetical protein|nr:hypothetical protein [Candidatus Limnocylindrales bacterium]